MNLTEMLADLRRNIIDRITELLASKGVKPEDFNGNMLDVRDFNLNAPNKEHQLELLLDGYQICYLDDTIVIDERGMQASIEYLAAKQIEDLCMMLDALSD